MQGITGLGRRLTGYSGLSGSSLVRVTLPAAHGLSEIVGNG